MVETGRNPLYENSYEDFARVWVFDEFDIMGDERLEIEKGKWTPKEQLACGLS